MDQSQEEQIVINIGSEDDLTRRATRRRNKESSVSKRMVRSKSRLEESNWGFERPQKAGGAKKGDDWFLDEDFLEEFHLKKSSIFTVIQLVCLLSIMALLACTLSIKELKNRALWDLLLWKWEILILAIISGHLISGWGVRVIVFVIERSFLLKMRVLYFVYGMRNAVQNCLWLGLVLIAWNFLVAENNKRERKSRFIHRINTVFICLLVGVLIWLVKTLIVKVLASNFHMSSFFERIKDTLFKQYVIKKLLGSPLMEEEPDEKLEGERVVEEMKRDPELMRDSSKRQYERHTIDTMHKLNKMNVSALKMKRLISLVQSGLLSSISTLDEDLSDSIDEDEPSLHIRDETTKKEAKKIFLNVAREGSQYIYLDDLKRFMNEDKAVKAMESINGANGSKEISQQCFTDWMIVAIRERRDLAYSLDDTKTAVDELHQILNILVSFIIVIIWLVIFGLRISHFLVLISSQLLLVVFVFGNTCKNVFEAIIFLFIMHPFDVGDRCEVDDIQLVVEEMNILSTVFLRADGQKITYPNSVLASKPIGNYCRSPDMGDQIEFSLHISTPWEKIEKMKDHIINYIKSKNDVWYNDPMVIVKDVEDMNRLKMVVWPKHKMNHHQMGLRWERRSVLIEAMIKIFRELEIEYRMLPLEVNVRKMTCSTLPSNWTACVC